MKRSKVSRLFTVLLAMMLVLSLITTINDAQQATAQGGPTRSQFGTSSSKPSLDVSGLTPDTLNISPEGRTQVFLKLPSTPVALAFKASGKGVIAGQRKTIVAEQKALIAQLAGLKANAKVVGQLSMVVNGVSVELDANKINNLKTLTGVVAAYPDQIIGRDLGTSVPSIGVPVGWSSGFTGEGMRIAIIDDGIDYKHADFGGNASTTWNPLTGANEKVIGGYDFVGDNYNADLGTTPVPDPDPFTCPLSAGGSPTHHGTHVAGIALGYGVNADGTTYHGPYNASTPFNTMKIAPGVAPEAKLLLYRVFGCAGTVESDIIAAAIDRAVDPNNDGDPSDAVEVINMSLGSSYGGGFGIEQEAIDNAVAAGVIVVASAGNSGDSYYVVGNPSASGSAISVANTSAYNPEAFVSAPAAIAGSYVATGAAFGPRVDTTGITGTLAAAVPNTACAAITSPVAGKIALIDRGTCSFGSKVAAAQAAGAVAVLMCNNVAGAPIVMGGDPLFPNITIPSVMISLTDCNTIKTQIANPITVTLRVGASFAGIDASSSRGPRRGSDASRIILKPDIAAPGSNIFSAAGNTGSEGKSLSGTSMAAPHVAGAVALLKQQNPKWSVQEIKALVMNTAISNVKPTPTSTLQFGPGRVGSGLIDVANAVREGGSGPKVIAYDKADPLLVSVSFGLIEATGPTTVSRQIELKNKGNQGITYAVGLQNVVQENGTTVSVSPSSVTVPANGKATVTVTINTNPGAASQPVKHDATVDEAQGGLPREWLSEVAGYVTFTATNKPSLRVAYHAVPRPASNMSAPETVTLPDAVGTTSIPLTGSGMFTGALTGAGSQYNVLSTVSPFELKYISGDEANDTPISNNADVKYVGVTSDFAAHGTLASSEIYFAISTQSDFGTIKELRVRIWIDKDRNGTDDFLLDVPNLTVSSLPVDVLLSRLTPLAGTGGGLYDFVDPVYAGGSFPIQTYRFNSNVIVLAVGAGPGWLNLTNGVPFNFQVDVQSNEGADLTPYLTYNPAAAPLDFTGASVGGPFAGLPWYVDFQGADDVPVSYNLANYVGPDPLRVLLVHYLNGAGSRAEVVTLKGPGLPNAGDTIGQYRASAGQFLLRKTNTAGPADITVNFGVVGQVSALARVAVSGDWNGDGVDTVGYYETYNHRFVLTNSPDGSGPSIIVPFGVSSDTPIVGDWNGDGTDGIGVYRSSDGTFLLRNTATAGAPDYTITTWQLNGVGVAGDWNGDGIDSPGIFYKASGKWVFTNYVCNCFVTPENTVIYGNNGDFAVVGDWDGDGYDGLGVYRPSTGIFYLRNSASAGAADIIVPFGVPNDRPVAGHWVNTTGADYTVVSLPPGGASETAPSFEPRSK
ncbi:MAG: S8 family serine peptidase [Anaerolineae bacterium]|nr:S8 family serine peptidase [Anaerolineae bacterium]